MPSSTIPFSYSMPAMLRTSLRGVEAVAACAAVLIAVVMALHAWKGAPYEQLTRDPLALFDAPMYVGFLSQAGCLVWAAGATVCLFAAVLLGGRRECAGQRRFLIASGLLTLMLGLDDIFLLHEQFFPFLGIHEKLVYVGYGLAVLLYLLHFRRVLLASAFPLLGMALIFFALSMSMDVLQPEGIPIFLLEDGAKLIGILSWAAYFVTTCRMLLLRAGLRGA